MKYSIFDSMIWKSKLNYQNKEKLIKVIEEEYKKSPNKTPIGWKCNVHSSFKDFNNLEFSEKYCNDLLDLIVDKFKEFLSVYEKDLKIQNTYEIINFWYNVYSENQFQEVHDHGESLFSGCYYLKFNKNIHHQTEFYNPNFDLDYSKLENNPFFVFNPDCDEDDLIIFPSKLKHGTKGLNNKNSKDMRIVISFNITNPHICKKNEHNRNNFIEYL